LNYAAPVNFLFHLGNSQRIGAESLYSFGEVIYGIGEFCPLCGGDPFQPDPLRLKPEISKQMLHCGDPPPGIIVPLHIVALSPWLRLSI